MPIALTKYNKISNLHNDLSNNSYVYNKYIITCKEEDTYYVDSNDNMIDNKIYTNNKANYLIHRFSHVKNCNTKFNNEDPMYKYKKPLVPRITDKSSINEKSIQKIIQNTVRVASSLYSNNLASLHINSDNIGSNKPWNNSSDRVLAHGKKLNSKLSSIKENYGVDIKHNSYDRYLGRKKSQYLKEEPKVVSINNNTNWPKLWGNKSYKLSIVNCKKTC